MDLNVIYLIATGLALIEVACGQGSCRLLSTPRNGLITGCTRGSRKGSICTTSCKEGYTQHTSTRQCRCFDDFCVWTGRNAICNKKTCTRPDFDDARLTIVDEWPNGFAGLIQFRNVPTKIVDGWSLILVFDKGLGPNAQLSSWGLEPTTVSVSRNAFTVNNLPHNNNLTAQGSQLSALFVVDHVEGENPERGYVGMYGYRVGDATCYEPPQPMSLLKEFPPFTTPPPTTTTASTTPTTTSAVVRRISRPATTTEAATTSVQQSNSGPPKIVINFQLKAPTIAPVTTLSPATTTTKTTSSHAATTSVFNIVEPSPTVDTEAANETATLVSSDTHGQSSNSSQLIELDGRRCKEQNHDKRYRTQKGWIDDGSSFFSGNAVVDVKDVVGNWLVVVVFAKRVQEVQVWNTVVAGSEEGGFLWKFGAHTWNSDLHPGMMDVNFIARLYDITEENPDAYVYLCSSDFVEGDPIRWFNGFVPSLLTNVTTTYSTTQLEEDQSAEKKGEEEAESTASPTQSPTKASSKAALKTTTRPTNLARCKASEPNGRRPRKIGQTKPKWKRGKDQTRYDYNEVLYKSILFYEAQRAGALPPKYNRIPWRGDSTLKDGCIIGADLSGGWFDAGDYHKFTFPMAFSVTTLAWGGLMFREAYAESGNLNRFLGSVKWPVNFLMKAHISKYELVGMIGNGRSDHHYWGRPEEMRVNRAVYTITDDRPGSEVAAETAAALASAYLLLKKTHRAVANAALSHAEELYEFADTHRGHYHESMPQVAEFYASVNGYLDELVWGAAWLYKATKKQSYLDKAEKLFLAVGGKYSTAVDLTWDNKMIGCQTLLANLTGKSVYREGVERYMNKVMTQMHKTPQGMLWSSEWGPNRYAASAAFIGLAASQFHPPLPGRDAYIAWSRKQIHLILGDAGRSYVIGFGKKYPKNAHHRASSCPPLPASCNRAQYYTPTPNHYILYGAMVGGPDDKGNYEDNRQNYRQSEVALDYNAGFQSAVAGLKQLVLQKRKKTPTAIVKRRRRPTNPPKRKPASVPKRRPTSPPKRRPTQASEPVLL